MSGFLARAKSWELAYKILDEAKSGKVGQGMFAKTDKLAKPSPPINEVAQSKPPPGRKLPPRKATRRDCHF